MSRDPHIANIFSAEEEDCLRLEQITAYQTGNLDATEKHQIERHLLNCELCALAFESISEEDSQAIAAGADSISEAAWNRVAKQEERKRRGAFLWISAAASIAILITVGFFTINGPSKLDIQQTFSEALENTHPPLDGFAEEDTYAMENETENVSESPSPTEIIEEFSKNGEAQIEEKNEGRLSAEPNELRDGLNKEKFAWAEAPKKAIDVQDVKTIPFSESKAPVQVQGKSQTLARSTTLPPSNSNMLGDQEDSFDADEFEESLEDRISMADDQPTLKAMEQSVSLTTKDNATKEVVAAKPSPKKSNDKRNERMKSENKAKGNVAEEAPALAGMMATDSLAYTTTPTAPKADAAIDGRKQNTFDDGLTAYNQGDFRSAASDFRKTTEQNPSNLHAHLLAADAYLRISQPQAAMFHIERVLAQPGNTYYSDAEWYKALAYIQMQDTKNAKKQLEIVIARNGRYKSQAQKALKEL